MHQGVDDELPPLEFDMDFTVTSNPNGGFSVQPNSPANTPSITSSGAGAGPAPGWPFPTGSVTVPGATVTGTATISTGQISGQIVNSKTTAQIVNSSGQPLNFSANPVAAPSIIIKGSSQPMMNFIAPTPKDDVLYVIVKKTGETLELTPNTPITPREMINISVFLSVISGFIGAAIAGSPQQMIWSELIENLGIERHFVPGQDESAYDSTGKVLHVLLKDPV